ncbi:PIN domain-containing protein [Rhizobium tumorigenes]|uniref:Type II toxin-antitoxin system VapC family toxin n=1 Tax=Rhizobium tumorigenes TaxID=2041385 RepID=A0AAF1K2Q4_9HYPH|nr:type II toxin-antitoxin system VapC family toxin [Rhizobium tumorigenes]WFR94483.1 type II toxin-antitoxin system VapC family toxin [Rhizobium tumorigenes]
MTMYGLDTNVVIRLLTNDDPQQRRLALEFAEGLGRDYTAFVSLLTVVELDWALRSGLGFSRRDVVRAVGKLLQVRGLEFESHNLIIKALRFVSNENIDFADALISFRSEEAGCRSTKTFDKKAASRVPGMELLV